jgi:1-deoxy-D-xylulose-5-phosphate reductoisomerase
VLNAANEEAVSAFLQGRIGFLSIPDVVAHALDAMPATPADSIDALLDADAWARAQACAFIARKVA